MEGKRLRIKQLIEDMSLSQNEFAHRIGVHQGNLSKMLSGGRAVSSDVINRIAISFDISVKWLMYGEGDRYLRENVSQNTGQGNNSNSQGNSGGSGNITTNNNNYTTNNYNDCKECEEEPRGKSTGKTIKYYPAVNGSMGGVQFLDDPDESFADIVIPGFSDCEFAINVYGDSMHPIIKSGQIVLLMSWRERFIEWGRIYLVVTKSGYRTIKYLKPSKNEGYVVCESENKENSPAFEIEKEEILRLFLVKGWICKDAI